MRETRHGALATLPGSLAAAEGFASHETTEVIEIIPAEVIVRLDKRTLDALSTHQAVGKTMTNDNGIEFQRDESLQKRMGIPIFFCDPASPWQRGSIENLNGLVRQYLPKSSNLDKLSVWAPKAFEETLNFRPRKTLGWKTPHEIFFDDLVMLTSNPLLRFGLEFSTGRWVTLARRWARLPVWLLEGRFWEVSVKSQDRVSRPRRPHRRSSSAISLP